MQDSMEEFKQEQDETFRKQDSVEEFKQEQEETFRKLSSANSLPVLNDINAMESPDIVAKAAKEIKFQPPQVPEMVMM
nr:pantothenate kinase 2-like [Ipomoea batatas]